ncbi:MAG: M20/M25/M40 family metallo-hydrolase, partial [Actinobacteria bacterium]|nr:M20/M25/M40 family metallo-hydrolase [Actinomycetota bacterium]
WQGAAQDRLLHHAVDAAAARVGQRVAGRPANGAGDTNLLGSLGIPTLDGFGPRGGGAHAESEHILVASLFERIELLGAVLTAKLPDQRASHQQA